jgi:hypothetical protein
MACGDFIGMYAGTAFVKVPVGPFVRDCFYSGKTLPECFAAFEREYGGCSFVSREAFNPLEAAAMIRRDWYRLKRSNHLPPRDGRVTLNVLLDHGVGGGNRCPAVKQGGR